MEISFQNQNVNEPFAFSVPRVECATEPTNYYIHGVLILGLDDDPWIIEMLIWVQVSIARKGGTE